MFCGEFVGVGAGEGEGECMGAGDGGLETVALGFDLDLPLPCVSEWDEVPFFCLAFLEGGQTELPQMSSPASSKPL